MRQATENDFKPGVAIYDKSGNEFIIKNRYEQGIFETNQGCVVFLNEARFFMVKDSNSTSKDS